MSRIRALGLSAVVVVAGLTASAQAAPQRVTLDPVQAVKQAACEKVWRAQKMRRGSHEVFIAACVAKG